MKKYCSQKIFLSLLCFLSLISLTNTLGKYIQDDVQTNVQYPKAVTSKKGNVLVLTSEEGTPQVTHVAELDKDGRMLYNDSKINRGYTADGQLVEQADGGLYIFSQHNKQNVAGADPNEYLSTFKEKATNVNTYVRKDKQIYQKTSLVSLKNGRILVAGIFAPPKNTFGVKTTADVNIFNPTTKTFTDGKTINTAYSNYIHCYEQVENEVYCIYVSYEDVFISKLKIQHYTINGDLLVPKKDFVIKNFYTEFNFLKATIFNSTDALILFQIGNPNKRNEDGKSLYYYNIRVDPVKDTLNVERYEYLYPSCKYQSDPEDYNADIAVFSKYRIYAVCEADDGRFKGFYINPNHVNNTDFYFQNFEAKELRYPLFAKFGQSLGLFYTHINQNNNKKVSYQIMNYPYCEDYKTQVLIPKNRMVSISLGGYSYIVNPYPASRANEKVNIKFKPFNNITIEKEYTNEKIQPNIEYSDINSLKIIPKDISGIYYLNWIVSRYDYLDGTIEGKTCKAKIYTPECLERCDSCTEKGNAEHHQCLGCNPNGPYYYQEDTSATFGDFGKPHNCPNCNISCSSCFGGFIKEIPTTNCRVCDYDNNYFHYEYNNKTCISNETKKYWESVLGVVIYLDKTPGPDKKHLWRWKHCHPNCAECFEKGDDTDNKCTMCKAGYYFYCNQTEGHGIPGSCNNICPNNGFYVTTKEKGREKCCPCIDHCKECSNSTHCDKCYQPFLKTNEGTLCNESCGYCLAEDRVLGECVNCKTRYGSPRYTLNKTCVSEIPFIDFLKKYHHIVDDQCNLLIGCKDGCHKCDPWYTDQCTECSSGYYKEDKYGDNPQPKTFYCFDEPTCKGIKPYPHNYTLEIGGVPVQNWEGEGNVCLNCRRRNNSYRLPEDDFYCGNKLYRTYVSIKDYNKLSWCYERCAACNDYGNGMIMNCTKCRDPSIYWPSYEILKYLNISISIDETQIEKQYENTGAFNCYRKPPKCGIFPYYHDYDLGDRLELEDCGEQCDICLYNMTCPEDRPFIDYATRECIEVCGAVEMFTNSCAINNDNSNGVDSFVYNPFGLKNPYDLLNNTATLNEILSASIFSVFDLSIFKQEVHNYFGKGQIYNLEESRIIYGNNISIEISSVDLELKKISKLLNGQQIDSKASIIDLSTCQSILKKKYSLSNEESLILLKGDFLDKIPQQYITNKVSYQLFSTSLGAFLPLIDCKEEDASVDIFNVFNSSYLLGNLRFKLGQAADENLNIFDPKSTFYHDICTPFTNENGNDVLPSDRRRDYFSNDYNLCEKGCEFLGYNETIKRYMCRCQTKSSSTDESNYEQKPMEIPADFYKQDAGYSNIKVFKCASQVFSAKGQKANFGSYILLLCLAGLVGMIVIYFYKGKKQINKTLDEYKIKIKNQDIKPEEQKDANSKTFSIKADDIQIPEQDSTLKDNELNFGPYPQVVKDETRTILKMFWSFLKHKQIILFTFFTADKNLRIIKISLFILFISFYLAFTALFFNDSIMRAIYIYKGNTDAAVHVTNIILSSICSLIMAVVARLVALNDRDISKIKSQTNIINRNDLIQLTKRSLNIRAIIFFSVSTLIVGICWYYVSAFCAVFKNSQGHYFINTFVAFLVCNLWPFVTSIITVGLRHLSLKKKSPGLYKFSQIVSLF